LISVPVFAEVALVALLPVLANVVTLEVCLGRRLEVAAVAGVPETVVNALLVGLADWYTAPRNRHFKIGSELE
jgi:hypothetical protein